MQSIQVGKKVVVSSFLNEKWTIKSNLFLIDASLTLGQNIFKTSGVTVKASQLTSKNKYFLFYY
jgi:hypothetical protein